MTSDTCLTGELFAVDEHDGAWASASQPCLRMSPIHSAWFLSAESDRNGKDDS